jgi:hypothetical protein
MYAIREASPDDVQVVAALLRAYMLDTYQEQWPGSVNGLLQDGFGARFRALIAALDDQAVAFLAWERSYDLHHCLTGGHVLDLYVAHPHRAAFGNDYILGGKAFRHPAQSPMPMRKLVRSLPRKEWNFEP